MKKVLLTLITVFAINAAVSAQMRFGVKGGLNLANQSITAQGFAVSPSMRIGFHGGVVLDSPLSESISIQPGLLFSQKGFKLSNNGTDGTVTFNYLEIPVNFMYNINESFSLGAGPYLGYALSGTTSSGGQSADIEFGTGKGKRLDFGLNATIGYEVTEGLLISANYSFGLANISDDTSTIKNNVIGISLTKFFGEK